MLLSMTTKLGYPGIIALAGAIPDMRALAKLDISNNYNGQGELFQLITKVCNTKGIELDDHESENDDPYPGDY
jgi:hypothetical protein